MLYKIPEVFQALFEKLASHLQNIYLALLTRDSTRILSKKVQMYAWISSHHLVKVFS